MKGIFGILIAMLITVGVMVGSIFTQNDQVEIEKGPINTPEYHVQIIIQNTDEHFWTQFKAGAIAASKDLEVFSEFVTIPPRNVKALTETIEQAIYSQVDAIAFQPVDYAETEVATLKALEEGLAVVNYENDKYLIPEVSSVGSNSYDIGYTAGSMIVPAVGTGNPANIAVILDEGSSQGDSQYKNMKVQGILDANSMYGKVNLIEVYTLDPGMFEAERLINTIISKEDDINVIICVDEKSTPAVAQVLVDRNKVGDIEVIGYGTMSQTLDYIKRGVIYGTVSPKAYEIGYQTVVQMCNNLRGESISDSSYIEQFIIDKGNVEEYIMENENDE